MPAQAYWFAVAAFALVMTLAWLFVQERVTTTGMLAAVSWAYCALSGDAVFVITDAGEQVSASVGNIQYLAATLGLLSFLAVILYRFGYYPPNDDEYAEDDYLE